MTSLVDAEVFQNRANAGVAKDQGVYAGRVEG